MGFIDVTIISLVTVLTCQQFFGCMLTIAIYWQHLSLLLSYMKCKFIVCQLVVIMADDETDDDLELDSLLLAASQQHEE